MPLVVFTRLAQQNDSRLAGRLAAASHDPDVFSQRAPRTFRAPVMATPIRRRFSSGC